MALQREFFLNFHGLGNPGRPLEPGEEQFWLPVERFEEILDDVVVPNRSCVSVTFDDGNVSDVEIALPRLLARKLTARFFVLAGRLDAPRFLSRAAVRALKSAGMTIGSHGYDHVKWPDASDQVLTHELADSKRELSDLIGAPIGEVAVPYGAYNWRILRWLKRYGYRAVYTSDCGSCRRSAWLRPRTCVTRDMSVRELGLTISEANVVTDLIQCLRLCKRQLAGVGSAATGTANSKNIECRK